MSKPHEKAVSKTVEWITPKWVIDRLGGYEIFDLDPCAHPEQPWKTAKRMIAPPSNGLSQTFWDAAGMVWLNPPYGIANKMLYWLKLMSDHNNGIAILPGRMSEQWMQRNVLTFTRVLFFPRGRINFCRPDGTEIKGCPHGSVLLAYGDRAADVLWHSRLHGHFYRPSAR